MHASLASTHLLYGVIETEDSHEMCAGTTATKKRDNTQRNQQTELIWAREAYRAIAR